MSAHTDRGRLGGERFRLAGLAVAAGAIERGVSTFNGVVRVALLTWGLSASDYGLYVSALGVIATAGLVDLGIHYGLVNAIADARGRDDEAGLDGMIATAFLVYTAISAVSLITFVPLVYLAPIRSLLHLAPGQVGIAREIVAIGFGSLLLAMPLRVFQATFTGLQQQYVASLYRTIASILQLAAVTLCLLVWRGRLLPVVIASVCVDLASSLLFAVWARRRNIAVRFRMAQRKYAKTLLSSGVVFLVSNVANMLKRGSPTLIVAHVLGTAGVPPFSVPLAMFTIGMSACELLSGSLWPAYGEAAARDDWPWISRAFRIGSDVALHTAALIAVLGAVAGDEVMKIWTPRVALPSRALFMVLALWMISQAAQYTVNTLLCGLNRNRPLMFILTAEGALTCIFGVWFGRHWGAVGVAASMFAVGTVSTLFVNVVTIPMATEGRLRVQLGAHVKLGACSLLGATAGLLTRSLLSALPVLVIVAGAASATVAVYGLSAWTFGLSADVRGHLTRRLRARRPLPEAESVR